MYTISHEDQSFNIKTAEDLKEVPTVALVATYNELTGKSIKKFASRAKAEEQVAKLIIEVDAAPEIAPVTSTKTGRKSVLNKLAVIRMETTENPKREGSQAAANFDKYRDGMTIDEVQKKGVPLADIRWNLDKGFIRLEEPGNEVS